MARSSREKGKKNLQDDITINNVKPQGKQLKVLQNKPL